MSKPAVREQRGCDECGQVDDHPRHMYQDAEDGKLVMRARHMDCCAAAGCPDGTCPETLARLGNLKGASLVGALTGGS